MNKRKMKKFIRRFLDGGDMAGCAVRVSEWAFGDTGWMAEVEFPGKLHREIYKEAVRCGWNGYWASSPFLVYLEDGGEFRPGPAANCCKAARRLAQR